ncbi:N-acetylglucosamine-6-phosphate deacetylase [Mucisphaera calidilacus]|uniref:N-acetylglucosamine-6-phosphate deacetylase n=1 Tax=Mucisphaera calidilacus TaxID=2527982 RepID=A0A518BU24_9BACT|nr:N-acetylglucosamine-6-phosphate deacetylase [Mucisphaera calidilacus]QDU70457.1 N-acetylglucosamine-6-phosphate deacetylase [Mucisphaera calidilacus]
MNHLVDLQVNGYGGVDFNADELSVDDLHRACDMMRRDGVDAMLATVITDDVPVMVRKLARIVEMRERDELIASVIAGLHVEGPFISPVDGYRGAHPSEAVKPATVDEAKRLFDAADGLLRIFTLAPEHDADAALTRWLADRSVIVSAGHTDAPAEALDRSIDAGLSMVTHLGNGCPTELPRHDNIIQRLLSRAERLLFGFIGDGIHVPGFALRNYLAVAGYERCFVVSDASAPAGMGPGRYGLGRLVLDVADDLTVRLPGTGQLAGSAMPLRQAAGLLQESVGLRPEVVDWMTKTHPRLLITPQSK